MKHIILALLFISVIACKQEGTDTGNPSYDQSPPEPSCSENQRCMPTPYIKMQVGGICGKLNKCFAIDESSCQQAVNTQVGLAQEIVLQIDTYQELDNLYTQKKLVVNTQNYATCGKAVSEMSCDASIIQNAVSGTEVIDYSNVHIILQADSSCKDVYSLKEQQQ